MGAIKPRQPNRWFNHSCSVSIVQNYQYLKRVNKMEWPLPKWLAKAHPIWKITRYCARSDDVDTINKCLQLFLQLCQLCRASKSRKWEVVSPKQIPCSGSETLHSWAMRQDCCRSNPTVMYPVNYDKHMLRQECSFAVTQNDWERLDTWLCTLASIAEWNIRHFDLPDKWSLRDVADVTHRYRATVVSYSPLAQALKLVVPARFRRNDVFQMAMINKVCNDVRLIMHRGYMFERGNKECNWALGLQRLYNVVW